jgi:hypothetical protein
MDKASISFRGIRILGTTLWSHVPDDLKDAISHYLNDYRLIQLNENNMLRRITPNDTNRWFEDEKQWLKQEIHKANMEVTDNFFFKKKNEGTILICYFSSKLTG